MQNLLSSHPFATVVGMLTERATDSGQLYEDWSLMMEVCDTINETDDGPKEAIRAIRKRITSSAGKDHVVICFTLTLLEACVRNCGKRFHNQIANKDFLHDFLKILSPKNSPTERMQLKVLLMLKSWVESNWDVPGRKEMEKVYYSLHQKGYYFPDPSEYIFERNQLLYASADKESGPSKSSTDAVYLPDSTNGLEVLMSRCNCRVTPPVTGESYEPMATHQCNQQSNNDLVGTVATRTVARTGCVSCQQTGGLLAVVPSHKRQPVYVIKSGQQQSELDQCGPVTTTGASSLSGQNYPPLACSQCPESSHIFLFNPDCRLPSASTLAANHIGPRRSLPASASCSSSTTTGANQMVFDADGTIRHLTSAQRSKLAQDLSVVETNVNVLNDMLAELSPDTVTPEELHLLEELHQTCRSMHLRVIYFLSQVSDEQATPSLLQVNENLHSAFLRYKRFDDNRLHQADRPSASTTQGHQPALPPTDGPRALPATRDAPPLALTSSRAEENLIDLETVIPSGCPSTTSGPGSRDQLQLAWPGGCGAPDNRSASNVFESARNNDFLSCLAVTPSSRNTGQEPTPSLRQTIEARDDSQTGSLHGNQQHGRPMATLDNQRTGDPASRDLIFF